MDDDMKDALMRTAIIEFGFNFSKYVKELDPVLWKRAVDYAKDVTKVEGVSFQYPDDEEGVDDEGTEEHTSD